MSAGPRVRATAGLLLAAALALGFHLRLQAADHRYLSQWDEAYHALVAKHLAAHPLRPTLYDAPLFPADYRSWTEGHVWLHKPPMALWLMAAALALAGDEEPVIRLPSVVLGTLSILLTFLVAVALWGSAGTVPGLVAAALQALNPLFVRLVSGTVPTDHVDVVLVFFVELTVWLGIVALRTGRTSHAILAGLALGLGFLAKSVVAFVAAGALAPLLLDPTRSRRATARLLAAGALGFAAGGLPWSIYAAWRWPAEFRWEAAQVFAHLVTVIEGHDRPWWYHLELIPAHYGGVPLAASLLVAGAVAVAAHRLVASCDRRLAVVLAWALLPYLFFSVARTRIYAQVAPAVPAVLLLVGHAAGVLGAPWRQPPTAVIARTAGASFLVVLALHLASLSAERIRADYEVCPWSQLYDCAAFRAAMRDIRRDGGPRVILNVGDGKAVQAMYYADALAYAGVPPLAALRDLLDRGHRVYLVLHASESSSGLLPTLREAGLLDRLTIVRIPAPTRVPGRHPYFARPPVGSGLA